MYVFFLTQLSSLKLFANIVHACMCQFSLSVSLPFFSHFLFTAPAAPSPAGISPAPPPANGNNASAVPQMVLTSGHVTQGVQGAQLLIPTSQGQYE